MESKEKRIKTIPKPTHFGSNLKFLRRMNGLSQARLGELLNISRNKIASYETGVVEPNALTFIKVSEYFHTDPREILENELSENPVDSITEKSDSDNATNQFITEQIDDFIIQTNEMTKVLEGYKTFIELQKESENYQENRALYSSLEDLLSILQKLITSNWKVIQSFFPNEIDKNL